MGFLDKVIGAANRVYTPLDNLDLISDSRWRRGSKLVEEGERAQGRIVGIERKFEGGGGSSTDSEIFALEIGGPGEPVIAGGRIRLNRMWWSTPSNPAPPSSTGPPRLPRRPRTQAGSMTRRRPAALPRRSSDPGTFQPHRS